jgi:hypothetical protein
MDREYVRLVRTLDGALQGGFEDALGAIAPSRLKQRGYA